ncbi:hypothetical protein [Nocardia sp. NPDC056000]|uniref:hypothetical protein n=1 Tax=Nocardia sp. NPDC056000 TaxID=3345674 RepID=UPI0035D6CEAA
MNGEDSEEAQARIFLAELEGHAHALIRRRGQWRDGEPNQAIEAELDQIRQQVRTIRRRFPHIPPPEF